MPFAFLMLAAAAAAETPPLPAFMTGCWNRIDGERWTQECWMEPRAGLMLGAAREGEGSALKSWEQLRIEQSENGTITFFASPNGGPAVPFRARSVAADRIEFVNADHYYPQRISYRLSGGRLEAEISLADGGNPARWIYSREAE